MIPQTEIRWTQDWSQNALVAHIEDADGSMWIARIQREAQRIIATLICRSAGRYISTNMLSSLREAQEWCYETVGAEVSGSAGLERPLP
jgi:hypothetical protein